MINLTAKLVHIHKLWILVTLQPKQIWICFFWRNLNNFLWFEVGV